MSTSRRSSKGNGHNGHVNRSRMTNDHEPRLSLTGSSLDFTLGEIEDELRRIVARLLDDARPLDDADDGRDADNGTADVDSTENAMAESVSSSLERGDKMKPAFDKMKTFVPAKDFELSKRFYAEIFEVGPQSPRLCEFSVGGNEFLLQDFNEPEFTSNCMYQLTCSDVQSAWRFLSDVVAKYSGTSVRPPKDEPWGKVVYLLGPSGELWHVTQAHS